MEVIYCDQICVPVQQAAQDISWLNYTSSVGVLRRLSFAASVTRELSQSSNECHVKVSRPLCPRAEMTRLRVMVEYTYLDC